MRPNQYHRLAARMTIPFGPALNWLYDRVVASRSDAGHRQPIVFILGAPRSGTTITYQCITHALDVSFPSHLGALFPSAPAFGLWLSERLHRRAGPHRSFRSLHGYSLGDGLRGPNEWDTFFRRFIFPSINKKHASSVLPDEWKTVTGYIDAIVKRPLVLKILNVALYLDTIVDWFPSARFLIVHRPLKETARSIYLAKRREKKAADELWYVRPPALLGRTFSNEFEQIVVQINQIYDTIECTRLRLSPMRFLDLELLALCERPEAEVARIRHWLGADARVRAGSHLPARLRYDAGQLLDQNLEDVLNHVIANECCCPHL
jgi:hypothetical protein